MRRRVRALVGVTAILALTPGLCSAQTSSPASSTGAVAGRIVRPDGLPQPDAQVVLAQRTAAGALRQLSWRARSAADGRYDITGVPPGRYLVLVRAIGSDVAASGRPDATLFPGVPLAEPGVAVEVVEGLSTEGIDVWLVPSPRRFTLSGRAFGPGGATAFDSLVIEMGRPGARATDVWNSAEGGGLFTIDPAPPGTLILRARATVGDEVLTGLAATTVATNPVEDIRITVRPLIEVTGRVQAAAGRVLPAGLSVALVPQALEPSVLYPPVAALVDADGRFRTQADAAPLRIVVGGMPDGWRATRRGARNMLVTALLPPTEPLDLIVGPAPR
jgi:hypothetical protein